MPVGSDLRVEVRGVSKSFGPVRALVGVTATFRGGRVAVVTGTNGSGKSTLLSLVASLMRPTSGTIDHTSLGTGQDVRGAVGWLGHDSLCYGDLSGRENLELSARLRGMVPSRAYTAAEERFDLASFANRPVRTYSRGQRQRISLARALLHSPSLLLLDEPTAGLDSNSTRRLVTILREEVGRGALVVVVTHDSALAHEVGDDAFELERGRLVPPTPSPREGP
jgi:ABC-type multidrug transport system ATPase subunit